ncbi:MAG: ribosome small subunit-dependent GTPase A [Candidatus Sericytochromatia bacterium]|nr:ribosome small subunit-dependent GTPase A [Candidatus Sericytochromatia bacterium]
MKDAHGPELAPDAPDTLVGIVVSQQANFFYVKVGDAEYACHMRGRLKKEGETPLVGDRVTVVLEPEAPGEPLPPPREGSLALPEAIVKGIRRGAILAIAPRTHTLERPAIANVDQLLVTVSADSPPFSALMLDRFLVAASRSGLEPTIVVNKRDLVSAETLAAQTTPYVRLGYRVITTEASADGVATLLPALQGRISVLAGPSGVGKSSLVNALHPGLGLRAAEVSTKLQRGRHTTRHAALYPIEAAPGALLADTPGFSYLSVEDIHPVDLAWAFPEMRPHIPACKFPSCLHVTEPMCAVRDHPDVSRARYDSYVRLLDECLAAEREAAERSSKAEVAFKRTDRRSGQEARLVKVDAAARQRDRKTLNQHLETHWHEETEEDAEDAASPERPRV